MEKLYQLYACILLSIAAIFPLHAMEEKKEQVTFGLGEELPLGKYTKTAICFSNDMFKLAYAFQTSGGQNYLHVMRTKKDEKFLSGDHISMRTGVQSLCFNTSADHIGVLTTEGKATIVHCDDDYFCEMPPCVDENNVLTALAYARGSAFKAGNFFATTHDGKLFKIKSRHQNKHVYSLPPAQSNTSLTISSLLWDKAGSMIAFAGTIVTSTPLGYIRVVSAAESSSLGSNLSITQSSITTACFAERLDMLAFAGGAHVHVGKTNNIQSSQCTVGFSSPVTQLCCGAHNKLFVGLENGSVYFCTVEQEGIKVFHDRIVQWEHPIKALSYNDQTKILGVATLYKAALVNFLLRD